MTGRYVSLENARRTSGISDTQLSDNDFTEIIEDTEYEVERLLNCSFTPRTVIDQLQGDNTNRIILRNNPVLRIFKLDVDGTNINLDKVETHKESGVISLARGAELSVFRATSSERYLIRIKYAYGILDETGTQTTTDDDEAVGTSVVIGVGDASSLTANDFIEISGMDGKREVCQIDSISNNDITVDQITQTHESGSLVVKLVVPESAKRLMKIAAALAGVANVVGSSFDEITGYSLGDLQIQKGEPYTQWRETAIQLLKEWNRLKEAFRVRPAMG